jgi:ABC-type dipeptide/oligopeptide/nickel transport system permease subunit
LPASGRVGLVVLAAFAVLAVAGPSLAGGSTTAVSGPPLAAPGWGHWLGTNAIGQDLARQWLTGARTSLTVGLLGGGGTFVMSTIVGAIAGWWGGLVDAVLMRLTDVGLVLPTVVVVIVISAYTHPTALSLSAVIAGTSWPASARLIRSQVLTLRGRAYLAAAAGFGASRVRVLWRHVLPDSALVLVAAAVRDAERAIAYEAGLAFLGLTVSTEGSWGTMLHDALAFQGLFLTHAWLWWLLPPVLTIAALLGALALSATAVDDRVNPRAGR